VSLGVLVTAVPRDAVDAAVAACGVGERRAGGKLPAHVVAYLTRRIHGDLAGRRVVITKSAPDLGE
ncbi:MAG: transposase domain-containing protein, partial [Actinobacteria bacterium]|nr:transposase domain-containing protein [Actinomycetota bacterium]